MLRTESTKPIAITITVLSCRNLRSTDGSGNSDPYIEISVRKKISPEPAHKGKVVITKKTPTIYRTLNPDWTQKSISTRQLTCEITPGYALLLEVWDEKLIGRSFLGRIEWDYEKLRSMNKSNEEMWSLLEGKKSGKVAGSVCVNLALGHTQIHKAILCTIPSIIHSQSHTATPFTIIFRQVTGLIRDSLTPEDFFIFLTKIQQQDYTTLEMASKIIHKHERGHSNHGNLTEVGFSKYLRSKMNNIMFPYFDKVYQDMNQPFCNYFINSSHNTYLIGHQLTSDPSLDGYKTALTRGCRCIEVDIQPGERIGKLIVKHIQCPTTYLQLHEVLSTVKNYAFRNNDWPLILDMEINCDDNWEDELVECIVSELGNHLAPPFDVGFVPTPMQLKRKILLKATPKLPKLTKLLHLLSNNTLELVTQPHQTVLNLSESTVDILLSTKEGELQKLSEKVLTRVYPKGTRVDSINFLPDKYWNAGCQVVALNFQADDKGMWMNHGKFLDNGNRGYILKPPFLITGPFPDPTNNPNSKQLYVKLCTGWKLPSGHSGNTVEIELSDYIGSKSLTTTITKYSGIFPIWDEEFRFLVTIPELALLMFFLKDSKGITLGYYTIPFTVLAKGFRRVPLWEPNGKTLLGGSLLVYVDSQTYIGDI